MRPWRALALQILVVGSAGSLTLPSRLPAMAQPTPGQQFQRALELLQQGREAEAERLLRTLVAGDPEHGPARLQLGRLSFERGDLDQAREHLRVATRSDLQRRYLAWQLLGRVELQSGNLGEAAAAFEESLELAPRFAPARVGRAQVAEAENDLWRALEEYRLALELQPDAPTLDGRAAQVARRMHAWALAECLCRRAIERLPDDPALLSLLAAIQSDAGSLVEAAETLERAAALGASDAAFLVVRARVAFELGDTERAIDAYRRALALDPEAVATVPAFALSSLSVSSSVALGDFLRAYLERHPDDPSAHYALGILELHAGNLTDAGASFRRLAELSPGDSRAPYNLSGIERRLGHEAAATEHLERFRVLKAEEDARWEAANRVHRLRLAAEDASEAGDLAEALRLRSEIAETPWVLSDDLVAAGRLALALDRGAEALTWFEKALNDEPYAREALEGLTEAAAQQGRDDVARSARHRLDLLDWPCDGA